MSRLRVDIPIVHTRHLPVSAATEAAAVIAASGVVDSITVWDQMTFFAPPRLWTAERSPLAAAMPDIDSFPDPYLVLASIHESAGDMGLTTTSDAIRRGPAEFTQTLMTLADISGKRTMVQMGAGEAKQCKPFGHKRSQGLKRLEDTFRIFRKFMEGTEPIDHEGHFFKLERASLGGARPPHRPELWALGGGPRLIDIATRYGDGFCTASPFVWTSPEQAREKVDEIRTKLSDIGRDPDEFGIGIWWICLMHDDPAAIEEAMGNDYIRWISTVMGRFDPSDWRELGIEPPMGDEWFYARNLLPMTYDEPQTADILSRSTPEIVANSWHHGSPAQMAEQIRPYVEAGVNWVQIVDFVPLTRPPEEGPAGLGRAIELARLLKETDPR